MIDNEIIKALECCSNSQCTDECPYYFNDLIFCEYTREEKCKMVLDLINRQKADLKQKDTEIDILIRKKETLKDEVENLKEELFIAKQKRANIFELIEKYEQGRIAGMKEFEKKSEEILIEKYEKYHLIGNARLKEGVNMFYQGRAEAIWECIGVNRNLVKEMTEQM